MEETRIHLGTTRKIRTADFESLDVNADIEEKIKWKDEDERSEKINQVVAHLIDDFVKSYIELTNTIGVKRSLGVGVLTDKDKNQKIGNVTTDDEEEIDTDFDILD